MNTIGALDTIFDFECENTRAFSYFGWELDNGHALYNYMTGYKASADATYEAFKKAVLSCDNEVTDTICYPLIFMYRHMIELMLKYSYIELKRSHTLDEIKCFLNKGHNLETLWEEVKPDFERLSARIGVEIDVTAIEHYIMEFVKIDKNSMAFRYPIEKKLNRFHNNGKHLFVPKLKERMDAFYDYVVDILYRLSFHMEDDIYNPEFDKQFTEAIYKSLSNINVALERINKNIESTKRKTFEVISKDNWSSLDELYEGKSDNYEWINSFSEQEKSVLLLLYHTGLQIPLNMLSVDPVERRKDVMKLAYGNAHDEFELDSSHSALKDDAFEWHIAYGNQMSLNNIRRTLEYLDITV